MNMTLQQQILLLNSAVISIVGRDSEGAYNSAFVKSSLKALRQSTSKRFISKQQFLFDVVRA